MLVKNICGLQNLTVLFQLTLLPDCTSADLLQLPTKSLMSTSYVLVLYTFTIDDFADVKAAPSKKFRMDEKQKDKKSSSKSSSQESNSLSQNSRWVSNHK